MARTALITGITGQDGAYLAESLLEQGLHGPRHQAPGQPLQHPSRRPSLLDPHEQRRPLLHALRRHDRRHQPHPRHPGDAAGRDLQPRRAEPRAGQLRDARIHGQRRRPRARSGCSRRCASSAARSLPLLPGLHSARCSGWSRRCRNARPPRSTPAARTAPPRCTGTGSRSTTAKPTGCTPPTASCSTTRAPSEARRSSRARSPGRGAHRARSRASAVPRQPRLHARLGPRPRLRRGDAPHVAAGRAGRLRHRDRRAAQRPRVRAARVRGAGSRPSPSKEREWTRSLGRRRIDPRRLARVGRRAAAATEPSRSPASRRARSWSASTPLLPADGGREPAGRPIQGSRQCSAGAPRIGFRDLVREMVAEDLDQALRTGLLRKEGFVVREPRE